MFYGYSKLQTESGKKFPDGEALQPSEKMLFDEALCGTGGSASESKKNADTVVDFL